MPQEPRGDGAPGTPGARDAIDPPRIRRGAHSLHLAQRSDEREITARPHVGAAERHQQVDVGAPRSYPLQRNELRTRLVVVHLREPLGVESAFDDGPRELVDVRALLSRLTGAPDLLDAQGRDPLGRDRPGEPLEARVRRAARRERDLLLEDDLHERLETRRAIPERRGAEPIHERREVRVAGAELGHAGGERLSRECVAHGDRTIQGPPS
ncbi:MAG TPA: hypothetical protein VIA63_08245 [Candidatus Limnocylindria bacterium]|jgi:hypothetical protein